QVASGAQARYALPFRSPSRRQPLPWMHRRLGGFVALAAVLAGIAAGSAATVSAREAAPTGAVETGYGGAAATVDPAATEAAIEVLRNGGNAIDAAVAANATLGVTEPYVAGIGGGGFMVVYL